MHVVVTARPTDWLGHQVEYLHQFRKQNLVEQVHYVQDGRAVDVWATPLRAAAESDTDTGVIFNVQTMDFAVDPTEFREKDLYPPERGDRIIRDVAGERIEYEVMSDGSEPPYRATDRYRLAWRIHTSLLRWEYNLLVRPCPAIVKISARLGAVVIA